MQNIIYQLNTIQYVKQSSGRELAWETTVSEMNASE